MFGIKILLMVALVFKLNRRGYSSISISTLVKERAYLAEIISFIPIYRVRALAAVCDVLVNKCLLLSPQQPALNHQTHLANHWWLRWRCSRGYWPGGGHCHPDLAFPANVVLMLGQRCKGWANIEPTFTERLLFVGCVVPWRNPVNVIRGTNVVLMLGHHQRRVPALRQHWFLESRLL